MKRQMIFGLMLASAFALTNCTEQLGSLDKDDIIVDETVETPKDEDVRVPYEIFVNDPVTKTISSGNKTYWVDEKSALANGLGSDAVDRVSLFSKPTEGGEYTHHGIYTYVGDQKFVGELVGAIPAENDWYCIYPYNAANSATNGITAKVVIGATAESDYTQQQSSADTKAHISGKNYPMFGTTKTNSADEDPTFSEMNHMSALVALKVVNNGWGDIVVTEAGLQVADPIVGEFIVSDTGNGLLYKGVDDASSNSAKVNLSNAITISKGDYATFYLAVKPFELTAGKSISVIVNNSSRTIEKLTSPINFEAGKITTLTIPVKELQHTIETDGEKFLSSMNNCTTGVTASINGKKIDDMIVIGSEKAPGSIAIKGKLLDVLDALPIGFFSASWNDKQGVLIVDEVEATIDVSLIELSVKAAFTRDELAKLINKNKEFLAIQPYSIGTFNASNAEHKLIALYEEPLHKSVDEEKANGFLKSYELTVPEIKAAIRGKSEGEIIVADAQKKLVDLLEANSVQMSNMKTQLMSKLYPNAKTEEEIAEAETKVSGLICVAMSLADCSVTLRTAAIGEEGATDPRVIMWGLDIYSDSDRKADEEAKN